MVPTIISPYYHSISNYDLPHIWPLYELFNEDEFTSHLEILSKTHDFISAEELLKIVIDQNYKGTQPKVFLSFDDGLKECFTKIAPILKRKGIPATFFINPAFIDSKVVFYRYKVASIIHHLQKEGIGQTIIDELKSTISEGGKLKYTLEDSLLSLDYNDSGLIDDCVEVCGVKIENDSIYMSGNEISSLAKDGFAIGGHSMNHPHFSLLKESEQLNEIKESVDFCQREYAQKQRLFAFPFYDFDMPASLYHKMYNKLNIDLSFGTSGIKKDSFKHSIQRLDMEQIEGDLSKALSREVWKYKIKKIFNKHVILRP